MDARQNSPMTSTAAPNERETTAAARRRIDAADRARRWREEQRRADAAREAELDALKAENQKLRVERDGLRDALGRIGAAAAVDEDLARSVVRMGAISRDATGRLFIGRSSVKIADIIDKAILLRSGGSDQGQAAYEATRVKVLRRLTQFILPPADAAP